MILTIKTDSKEAEIGLYDGTKTDSSKWPAGTKLSRDLLKKIEELLSKREITFDDLHGIVVFKGPGSFTGLRIGITVANTLAYGLGIPVVGEIGKNWMSVGAERIQNGENENTVMPEYGAEAHITQPKK